jgi:hypothetical protein
MSRQYRLDFEIPQYLAELLTKSGTASPNPMRPGATLYPTDELRDELVHHLIEKLRQTEIK